MSGSHAATFYWDGCGDFKAEFGRLLTRKTWMSIAIFGQLNIEVGQWLLLILLFCEHGSVPFPDVAAEGRG